MADDLNWFQRGIKSITGAGPNEGYFPDNQGWIPDKWTGGTPTREAYNNVGEWVKDNPMRVTSAIGTAGLSEAPFMQDYWDGKEGWVPDAFTGGVPTKEALGNAKQALDNVPGAGSIREFDMDDPESVKALQRRLGVKDDGMFGPKTEAAYRAAVAEEDAGAGKEALRYDYNDAMLQERMDGSKTKVGGLLKKAYSGMDKKLFGGKLPGGYSDKNVMTAEEFYNK